MKKIFNVILKQGFDGYSSYKIPEDKYEQFNWGITIIVENGPSVIKYSIPWENITCIEEKIS